MLVTDVQRVIKRAGEDSADARERRRRAREQQIRANSDSAPPLTNEALAAIVRAERFAEGGHSAA